MNWKILHIGTSGRTGCLLIPSRKAKGDLALNVCQSILVLTLFLAILACRAIIPDSGKSARATPALSSTISYQTTVDELASLLKSAGLPPKHLLEHNAARQDTDFDVHEVFSILRHLRMETGYKLDYVYVYEDIAGFPLLYARKADQPRYATSSEFYLAAGGKADKDAYLLHIQTDGSPESYFQLALLKMMGAQFYLYWHAGYNDSLPVCDYFGLENLLNDLENSGLDIPKKVKSEARKLNLDPQITIVNGEARVEFIYFTLWGGFNKAVYRFRQTFPHQLLESSSINLVEYDCGIVF